jgi:hypothetical protein
MAVDIIQLRRCSSRIVVWFPGNRTRSITCLSTLHVICNYLFLIVHPVICFTWPIVHRCKTQLFCGNWFFRITYIIFRLQRWWEIFVYEGVQPYSVFFAVIIERNFRPLPLIALITCGWMRCQINTIFAVISIQLNFSKIGWTIQDKWFLHLCHWLISTCIAKFGLW